MLDVLLVLFSLYATIGLAYFIYRMILFVTPGSQRDAFQKILDDNRTGVSNNMLRFLMVMQSFVMCTFMWVTPVYNTYAGKQKRG